jgi:hypothetical protein
MFLLWCGDVLPKVYIFVPRLVSGTGRGFGSAPQQKHTRYAPCPTKMEKTLRLEKWDFIKKIPDKQRLVKATVLTKYPDYSKLFQNTPTERKRLIAEKRDKSYSQLTKVLQKYTFREIKIRKWKSRSIGVELEMTLSELKKLYHDKINSEIFIESIQGATKIKEQKKDVFFCVKTIFQIQIEGKTKGMQDYEERHILVKAQNQEAAEKKLLKAFKIYETPYLNPYGEFVRWKFESFDDWYSPETEEMVDIGRLGGVEVFSKIKTRKLKTKNIWTVRKGTGA